MRRAPIALALLAVAAAARGAPAQEAPLRDVVPAESLPPSALSAPLAGDAPGSGLKTMPETLADAIGTWDLSLDGSNRRCELSLSGDSGPNGRVLRFPAGCRRALPVLARAAGWLFSDKGIRIVDANVRPLVALTPRPDARSMQGQAETGERYSLVPLQTLAMLPPPDPQALEMQQDLLRPGTTVPSSANPGGGGPQAIPGSQPVLPADTLIRRNAGPETATKPAQAAAPPAERRSAAAGGIDGAGRPMPGIYALDRFNDKDVCRIALDARPPAAREPRRDTSGELAPARILPGCRDGGIGVFDPVSWRFAGGHLTLKAKRGHAVNLVATGDGSWRRDPDVGTTFVLRRVE